MTENAPRHHDAPARLTMHARDFIEKWRSGSPAAELGERAGAQPHFIDLCRVLGVPEPGDPDTYWFDKAQRAIEGGDLRRAGLVATNSIRGGANRNVLERIVASGRIFEAWSDEA